MNAQQTDKMGKIIINLFNEARFQLEIETNLKKVDFLDVMSNLITSLCKPYKKPNFILLYIDTSTDHLPQIIKQLTSSLNVIPYMKIRQVKMFLIPENQNMKMLYTRMGTIAALNTQRKSINATVRKGLETYG